MLAGLEGWAFAASWLRERGSPAGAIRKVTVGGAENSDVPLTDAGTRDCLLLWLVAMRRKESVVLCEIWNF